jgi:hypothetical protein
MGEQGIFRMTSRQEKWRDITSYEGLYQVSNTGLVRSLPRTVFVHRNGRQSRLAIVGKILAPGQIQGGLRVVCLSKGNKRKTFSLARLVMTHHGTDNKPGWQVKHRDSNHGNNDIRNLYWEQHPGPDDTKAWRSLADRLMPGCSLETA